MATKNYIQRTMHTDRELVRHCGFLKFFFMQKLISKEDKAQALALLCLVST